MTNERSAVGGQAEAVGPETETGFQPPTRMHASLLAASERRILDALCRRAPAWMTPDRLTAIGAIGMVVAAIGYIGSNWSPAFLFVSSLGVAINWFGDSLDGAVARYRRIERPRYGYFLDNSVDALNILVFALGLGLSRYVSMAAALLWACSYFLLTIYAMLSAEVNRRKVMAIAFIGLTEIRLMTIAFNCAIFIVGPVGVHVAGIETSLYSALVALEAVVFIVVFMIQAAVTARGLDREGLEAPGSPDRLAR